MKKNNLGFSLIELIVVVLIIAIVAVALAPQVVKWVENSRIASDLETRTNLENYCILAIANEDVFDKVKDGGYEIIIKKSPSNSNQVTFEYKENSGGSIITYDGGTRPDPEDVFWKAFLNVGAFEDFEDFEEGVAIKTTPAGEDIVLDVHVYEGGYTFSELSGTVNGELKVE